MTVRDETAVPAVREESDDAMDDVEPPPLDASPRATLRWAIETFPPERLAILSAFGLGSVMINHWLWELGARVPTFFIDTLYHFPETLEHVETVRRRYDLDLRILRPASSREEFEAIHGPRLWERDLDRFHYLTKVEPLQNALADVRSLITGRRRDQSPTRANLTQYEPGRPSKINPLVFWTGPEVWQFVRDNEIPYNPLHDRGYTSIGDAPLTSPVQPGEPERAGRWRGLGRLECGIHSVQVP